MSRVETLRGATLRRKKSAKPDGGIRKLVCTVSAISAVSQIGCAPSASSGGTAIGTTRSRISSASRKKPKQNVTANTAGTAIVSPPGSMPNSVCTLATPFRPRKTSVNVDAPIKSRNIMPVRRITIRTVSAQRRGLDRVNATGHDRSKQQYDEGKRSEHDDDEPRPRQTLPPLCWQRRTGRRLEQCDRDCVNEIAGEQDA